MTHCSARCVYFLSDPLWINQTTKSGLELCRMHNVWLKKNKLKTNQLYIIYNTKNITILFENSHAPNTHCSIFRSQYCQIYILVI